MKALILAGGRGRRINEFTENSNKCMILLNNKPLIERSLDVVVDMDVTEIVIVVGYYAEDIINYYGNSYKDKRIKYVIQKEQRGLVHAIECSKNIINGDDFMLLLGDEVLINNKIKDMLEAFRKENIFGMCGFIEVSDRELIRKTYSIIKNEQNVINRLIEKPVKPVNNLQGTGNCIFKNTIFEYIEITPIHYERNEKELPDLIQCAIDDGMVVKAFHISSKYVNINSKEDLLSAEKYIKELE